MRSLLIFLLLSVGLQSEAQSSLDKQKEKAYEVVEKLPEVKAFIKSFKSLDTSVHVSLIIFNDPTPSSNYFRVQVGVVNSFLFETRYTFLVTPISYDIFFYDTANDKLLPLKEWRKNKKER